MPKYVPECPPRPTTRPVLAETYHLELKTPLFGGGAEVRASDPSFPLRGSAIRGQLRFWWRATRGRRCPDKDTLWQREEEIFGSARFASPVRVKVHLDAQTQPQYAPASEVNRFGPDGYAMFALQPGDRILGEGLQFTVTVAWLSVEGLRQRRAGLNAELVRAKMPPLPAEVLDIEEDVKAAVWAWVNFGGLGGRTRRGCGALLCRELAPRSVGDVGSWYAAASVQHGRPPTSPPLWPVMGESPLYVPHADKPVAAWLHVISLLRTFRQGVGMGREPGKKAKHPGRSRFPEPETIRQTMGQKGKRAGNHPPLGDVPSDAFPRAEFGLPIVFHFQNNEVSDTVLYPRCGGDLPERMASPLILKPLCLADGGAVPMILRLDVPWFTAVDLTEKNRNNVRKTFPLTATRRADLGTYTDPPSPLAASPAGSALEAFLAFAQNDTNRFQRA